MYYFCSTFVPVSEYFGTSKLLQYIQHLPRALNRTTLSPTIAALDSLGYHTFLAGTERLLILNGDMWHPSFALPLPRYTVYLFYRHKSTITDAAADIWHPSFANPLVTPRNAWPTCQAYLVLL